VRVGSRRAAADPTDARSSRYGTWSLADVFRSRSWQPCRHDKHICVHPCWAEWAARHCGIKADRARRTRRGGFAEHGLAALADGPRPRRPRRITVLERAEVCAMVHTPEGPARECLAGPHPAQPLRRLAARQAGDGGAGCADRWILAGDRRLGAA
jgi:hypothetical protein